MNLDDFKIGDVIVFLDYGETYVGRITHIDVNAEEAWPIVVDIVGTANKNGNYQTDVLHHSQVLGFYKDLAGVLYT